VLLHTTVSFDTHSSLVETVCPLIKNLSSGVGGSRTAAMSDRELSERKRRRYEAPVRFVTTRQTDVLQQTPVCVCSGSNGLMYIASSSLIAVRLQTGGLAICNANRYFNEITSITTTKDNQILVVDTARHSIFKIGHNDKTTLVAGDQDEVHGHADGVGSDAAFYYPHTIIWMECWGVWVLSDKGNQCIRSLKPGTWEVGTVCGIPLETGLRDGPGDIATMDMPTGMARFDARSFIVCDSGNNRIRKVTLGDNGVAMVTSLNCVMHSPISIAVDKDQNIFAVRLGSNQVHILVMNSAKTKYALTAISGNDTLHGMRDGKCIEALFLEPRFLHIDKQGCIVVCESNACLNSCSNWVRVIQYGDTVSQEQDAPDAMMDAEHGHLRSILNSSQHADMSIVLRGGKEVLAHRVILHSTSTFFRDKMQQNQEESGCLKRHLRIKLQECIVDEAHLRVLLMFLYTKTMPSMSRCSSGGNTPTALSMFPVAVALLEPELARHCLNEFACELDTGNIKLLADLAWNLAMKVEWGSLSGPRDKIFTFYAHNRGLVRSCLDTGMSPYVKKGVGNVCSLPMDIAVSGPVSVAENEAGAMYFAVPRRLLCVHPDGRVVNAHSSLVYSCISSITPDPRSTAMFVLDRDANCLYKNDIRGETVKVAGGPSGDMDGFGTEARFCMPNALLYMKLPIDRIFISDTMNHKIRELHPDTYQTSTVCGQTNVPLLVNGRGTQARMNEPMGMTEYDQNSFLVADSNNYAVRKVTFDAARESFVTSVVILPNRPLSLVVDKKKDVYVVCLERHTIFVVSLSNKGRYRAAVAVCGDAFRNGFRNGLCAQALFAHPFILFLNSKGMLFICERMMSQHTRKKSWCRVADLGLVSNREQERDANVAVDCENTQRLLTESLFADTRIVLKGNEFIDAHASLLYSKSIFFRTQLERLGRASGVKTGQYRIELGSFDVDKEQLMKLLQYVYTNRMPDLISGATEPCSTTPLQMYRVADMLLEKEFALLCMQQFAMSLTTDNMQQMADLVWTMDLPPSAEGLEPLKNEIFAFFNRVQDEKLPPE